MRKPRITREGVYIAFCLVWCVIIITCLGCCAYTAACAIL